MKHFFDTFIGQFSKSWWLEITTGYPQYIYHFGPFESESEAIKAQAGYVEDLAQEGAQHIRVSINRRPYPPALTEEYSDAA